MNKEKERAEWLAIAEKYFDATTNDNEEKALRDFLSSAESNHPAFDEIKAVMGYLAAARHIENVNAREKRAVRKKHLVHWAAAAIIAFIVGTGASQYKNQINNVLVFPGLFRGALDVGATTVSTGMMIAAANGIANHVSEEQLTTEYVLPLAYDKSAHQSVARAVAKAAVEEGLAKYPQNFEKLYK